MATWERIRKAGKRLLGRGNPGHGSEVPPTDVLGPDDPPAASGADPRSPPPLDPLADPDVGPGGELAPGEEGGGLTGWVEKRAERVVARIYETRAADLEERARRVVHSAYERSADDLEERAVRAMRRALEAEAERIKEAIEHGIAVKRREVRLSLLVLIASSLLYLLLYWLTHRDAAA